MKYWLIGLILLGFAVFWFLRWFAPSIIFHPWTEMEATPDSVGLAYENVTLRTDDDETIAGWFVPAVGAGREQGEGKTLLFFHGNAGNISHRLATIKFFHDLGLSVFIIDYRGFGESTGKPTVSGTLRDARAAWQWLTQDKKIAPSQIIVFGRSLGGGVAARLTTEVTPRALILESTFTSLYDVGKTMYPVLPKWVLEDDYNTLSSILQQHIPLLVVHSPVDEVIDFAMGRELYERYQGPKAFVEIDGAHGNGWFESLPVYEEGVKAFLEQY